MSSLRYQTLRNIVENYGAPPVYLRENSLRPQDGPYLNASHAETAAQEAAHRAYHYARYARLVALKHRQAVNNGLYGQGDAKAAARKNAHDLCARRRSAYRSAREQALSKRCDLRQG